MGLPPLAVAAMAAAILDALPRIKMLPADPYRLARAGPG